MQALLLFFAQASLALAVAPGHGADVASRAIKVRDDLVEWGVQCLGLPDEPTFKRATTGCCAENLGQMKPDGRCYGLRDSVEECRQFHSCCRNKWDSRNFPGRSSCR